MNLVTHQALWSVVAYSNFSSVACVFLFSGRTPYVKIMSDYRPGLVGQYRKIWHRNPVMKTLSNLLQKLLSFLRFKDRVQGSNTVDAKRVIVHTWTNTSNMPVAGIYLDLCANTGVLENAHIMWVRKIKKRFIKQEIFQPKRWLDKEVYSKCKTMWNFTLMTYTPCVIFQLMNSTAGRARSITMKEIPIHFGKRSKTIKVPWSQKRCSAYPKHWESFQALLLAFYKKFSLKSYVKTPEQSVVVFTRPSR